MVRIAKLVKTSKPVCIVDSDNLYTLHPLSMTAQEYRRWLWNHIKTRNSVEWVILSKLANTDSLIIHYQKPHNKPYAEVLAKALKYLQTF